MSLRSWMLRRLLVGLCGAGLFAILAGPSPARAQGAFADAQAGAHLPSVLARGDAGVARASWETAFLYNPAQLGHVEREIYWNILGVAAGVNRRTFDAIDFYADELEDVDNLSDEELRDVSDRSLDLLDRPAALRSTVSLPAVGARVGTVRLGAAMFVNQIARLQAVDTGANFADAVVYGQVDRIVIVSAGLPMGETGLALGASGRFVGRHVTAYRETVEDFDTPPIVRARSLALDLGAMYATPVSGLSVGATVYDVLGGRKDYERDDFYGAIDLDDVRPEDVVTAIDLLEDRNGTSLRLGLAYAIPPEYLGGFPRTTLVADWVSASSTGNRQSALRKLRVGVETQWGVLRLRGGLGQGYPSVGAGLSWTVLHLEYALSGRQEGLFPEDGAIYTHMIQFRIGR